MIFDFIWNDLLIHPMTNALIVLSNVLFGNYGLAIIAFTILIRLVTYPLTLRQLRATRSMQEMQPQMQEIQKKYKDPRRRQEEMMKLYREVGFNPLGCALPMLIQIPIWIALYNVIRSTLGATPEALFGLSGRLYDWHYITSAIPLDRHFLFLNLATPSFPLVVLVVVTTFVQQKLTMTRPVTGDPRQASMSRTMLWMMPLLFGWFTLTVPSGLGLYWFTTNLFGIVAAYLYNGPENFRWRELFTLQPMRPHSNDPKAAAQTMRPAAAESGADSRNAPAGAPTAAPAPIRTRRRRRRRRPRALDKGSNEA